jgi:hypothetical protein
MLKSVCKRSVPAKISSCPLCAWPATEDGEVDRTALIDHIAEDVHVFSLRSLPWPQDGESESEERIEYCAAKVRAWLTKYDLSVAATRKIPTLVRTEKPPMEHYFSHNEYFAEGVESSSGSETDSDDTMKRELEKLREEGSVARLDEYATSLKVTAFVSICPWLIKLVQEG